MIFAEKPEGFVQAIEVASTLVMHDGKMLLMRRHPNKLSGGTLGPTAGKVDSGETPEEGAVREMREESGIRAESLTHVASMYVTGSKAGGIRYHQFILELEERPEVTLAPEEHTEYYWMTAKEALQHELVHDLDLCIESYLADGILLQ